MAKGQRCSTENNIAIQELSYENGLFLKSDKLIVQKELRPEMLSRIHDSHLGIVKCKARASDILYWPSMNSEIGNIVSQCSVCNQNQKTVT